jgi:hypothetical protein
MRQRAIAFGFAIGLAVGPGAMIVASSTSALTAKVPFCLPGEKRVCTLGPPPVCHCEPAVSTLNLRAWAAAHPNCSWRRGNCGRWRPICP